MGKISAGPFSGPSGKIGNLIASSWRGISYFKTRPDHFTDANTPRQQAVRMKFRLLVPFIKACLPYIRLGFLGYSSPRQTACNAATGYNFKNGITGEFPCLELDYASLLLSRGTLPIADNAVVQTAEGGKINFTWSPTSLMTEAKPDDTAMVLAYNPDRKYAVYLLQGVSRIDGTCQLNIPEIFRGEMMECYLGFANLVKLTGEASTEYISDTMYLGKVTI